MPQDLSRGTYQFVPDELAFQLCPSFFWDFASCLSCSATRFGNPLRNFFPLATATSHYRKIENPASSAGRNHPCRSGSTRCSTSLDRKSTRLNSSHVAISYAVFCLKK